MERATEERWGCYYSENNGAFSRMVLVTQKRRIAGSVQKGQGTFWAEGLLETL